MRFFFLSGIMGDVIICIKLMAVVLVQWMLHLNMKFHHRHLPLILEALTVISEMKVSSPLVALIDFMESYTHM